MPKRFWVLFLLIVGPAAGFILALWCQWTIAFDLESQHVYFQNEVRADGSIVHMPTYTDQFNIRLHSEPYKPAASFDLFDEDTKK